MTTHSDLVNHLAAFLARMPIQYQARPRIEAHCLLDPKEGPLTDPEFVTGLVAYIGELGLWPEAVDPCAACGGERGCVRAMPPAIDNYQPWDRPVKLAGIYACGRTFDEVAKKAPRPVSHRGGAL